VPTPNVAVRPLDSLAPAAPERARTESEGSRPTLPALTGLRFVAALWVVLYHLLTASVRNPTGPIFRLLSVGYLGVSLFFVLSGFILAYTYLDPWSGTMRGTSRRFWWARVARVYPVYLLALALAFPIFFRYRLNVAPIGSWPRDAVAAVALAPGLLQAWWPHGACQWNCPGWSLSVEAFFYLLFPVVGVWLARRSRRRLLLVAVAWAVSLLLPIAYLHFTPDRIARPTRFDQGMWLEVLKFNPIVHLGEFVVGIGAGLAFLRRDEMRALYRRLAGWGASLAAVAMLWTFATVDGLPYLFLHGGLLAPLWALIVFALALGGGVPGRLLATRGMLRLGEASFALYLIHGPLLAYFGDATRFVRARYAYLRGLPFHWFFLGYVLTAIAASLAIFKWLEEPARRAIRARTSPSRGPVSPDVGHDGDAGADEERRYHHDQHAYQ
jgi:peptidoglycan/LPS O-acetylase OafA/YrhL